MALGAQNPTIATLEIDSDDRISVFSSSFGPEQSADYRVGDTFGKIYI